MEKESKNNNQSFENLNLDKFIVLARSNGK